MTWSEMTARARDAWIQERIFTCPVKWLPCWREPECGRLETAPHGIACSTEAVHPCFWPEYEWATDGCKEFDDPSFWDVVPLYTTDPAADYEVLVRVRDAWDNELQARFYKEITDIHNDRGYIWSRLSYTPGDYSHAAFLTLNGGGENDNQN